MQQTDSSAKPKTGREKIAEAFTSRLMNRRKRLEGALRFDSAAGAILMTTEIQGEAKGMATITGRQLNSNWLDIAWVDLRLSHVNRGCSICLILMSP